MDTELCSAPTMALSMGHPRKSTMPPFAQPKRETLGLHASHVSRIVEVSKDLSPSPRTLPSQCASNAPRTTQSRRPPRDARSNGDFSENRLPPTQVGRDVVRTAHALRCRFVARLRPPPSHNHLSRNYDAGRNRDDVTDSMAGPVGKSGAANSTRNPSKR